MSSYNNYTNLYSSSGSHTEDLQRLENETLRAQLAAMQFKLNQHAADGSSTISILAGGHHHSPSPANQQSTFVGAERVAAAPSYTTAAGFDRTLPGPNSRLAKEPMYNFQIQQQQRQEQEQEEIQRYQQIQQQQQQQQRQQEEQQLLMRQQMQQQQQQQQQLQQQMPSSYAYNNNSNYGLSSSIYNQLQPESPPTPSVFPPQNSNANVSHNRNNNNINNNSSNFSFQEHRERFAQKSEQVQFQERNARLIVFLAEANERTDMLRRFSNAAVAVVAFECERRASLIRRVQDRQGSETEVERLRQSLIKMEGELHEAAKFANELHVQLARSTQERSELGSENSKLTERLTEALALRSSEERLRMHEEEKNRNEVHELKSRMIELKEDNDRLRRHERQVVEDLAEATQKIEEYSAALDAQRRSACTQECTDVREHREILMRDNAKLREQTQQQEIKLRRMSEETVPLLIHKQEIAVLKSEVENRERLLSTVQQRNMNTAAAEDLTSRVQMQLEQERAVIVQLQTAIQEQRADHTSEILAWRNRESKWQIEQKSLEADLDAAYERLEMSRQDYANAIAAVQASAPARNEIEREQIAAKLLVAAKEIEKLSNEKQALIDMLNQHQNHQHSSARR